MFSVAAPLTLTLAKAFGVYMVAGGLSGLIDRNRWTAIMDGFRANPALTYISGAVVFGFGATLVAVHNIWTDPLSVVITIFGWAAAIEGILLIAWPAPLMSFANFFVRPGMVLAFALFTVALGVFLVVGGMTGQVGV